MEKCWFALQQTHIPPPRHLDAGVVQQSRPGGDGIHSSGADRNDNNNDNNNDNAPLTLGHIIASPRSIDQVINRSGVHPFPAGMPILGPQILTNFTWTSQTEVTTKVTGKGSILPILPGLNATASIGGMFQRRVREYWAFDRLELYTVHPSRAYVQRCLDEDEVAEHIERVKTLGFWSVYMVTGIAVARGGGRREGVRRAGRGATVGAGVEVPALAEVGPEVEVNVATGTSVAATQVTDFIWAVRLAKITKHGLQSDWAVETVTGKMSMFGPGAVFTPGRDEVDVEKVLEAHGMGGMKTAREPVTGLLFVELPEDEDVDDKVHAETGGH
ncbi:hypothetical protein QBC47DRAFT_391918 [Echria macrotheca]|uniref:Uncharacterized protein n=1 Tax=Echria macrotheca TaxID=438768 RepID=A0AAJ0B8T3_9PEZI|nr:hypothetical protein QBC47DRAFT_391918 [Echria macrotheca]